MAFEEEGFFEISENIFENIFPSKITRYTVLQGCFIGCLILQSSMVSYRSLLFIASAMNDKYNQAVQSICL